MKEFDYIIVGAGSAGCVLANRLSADKNNRVALLEAGGQNDSIYVNMPAAMAFPLSMGRFNWGFVSEPEPGLDNRRIAQHRGRGLGGSSAINGMVYVRGHGCDFDEWEEQGATGWGYKHCLPYFKRSENWGEGDSDYRSQSGPLAIGAGNGMATTPLYQAFIDAGEQAGYSKTSDYNGYQQEGFGPLQMTVVGGARNHTGRAFLKPVANRENLHVITNATVTRLLLDRKRATGVEVEIMGKPTKLTAHKEVIVAASAFNSPALLQVSGIGPARILRQAGVDVIHDLPGVGENLQDHLEVFFQHRCTQRVSLNSRLGLFGKAKIGLDWLLFKKGLGASNHFEAGGFIRSRAGIKWPDIQYHFIPGAINYEDGKPAFSDDGFQVHVGPNKAKSRGHVRIQSPDMRQHPKILFNYLSEQQDIEDWRRVIRLTREIMSQPAMDAYRGDEYQPGLQVETDAEIDAWVRQSTETTYHPAGTCRMGAKDDLLAVVDPECKVRGIGGLRVVDSSIFPTVPNGNLNAPTIMVAEKAADLILGFNPLPSSNAGAWVDPEWQTRQRTGIPIRSVN